MDAYDRLLVAAQAVCDAGVPIPRKGDPPPKKKQALAVANPYHRDWRFVFNVVRAALATVGWKTGGRAEDSLAVTVTCDLLKGLGITAYPAGLKKMLDRADTARRKRDK
jgi:hypothetical protein